MLRILILSLVFSCGRLFADPWDLKSWDSAKPLKLTQGWEFFWETWLTPESPVVQGIQLDTELCWQRVINPSTQKNFPSEGFGTYKISFHGLKSRKDGYEVFMRSAATAYRAYLYPDDGSEAPLIFSNGVVGTTAETSVPQPLQLTVAFSPKGEDQVWHLIIQVSNFHHFRSGLWQPPEIAPGQQLSTKNRYEREGFIFSMATVFIIGIYNFMIFMRRRRDYSSLSLAAFCAVVALRAFVTSDLLSYYFPEPHTYLYNIKYAIEYTTIVLGPISYGAFVHFSFHDNAKSRLLNFQLGLSLLVCLFTLSTTPQFFTRFVIVYQVFGMFIVVEYIYFLARAMMRKSEGATMAFSGTCLLSFALIYDIMIQHGLVPPPFISQYGVGAFVFLQSQVVATRFARAFDTAERLSRHLQKEVDRQTANIRTLMDHVPLGIFTIDRDLTIGKAYSTRLEEIFDEKDMNGQSALQIMFQNSDMSREVQSIVQSTLVAAFGEPLEFWPLNAAQLPNEYQRQQEILELDWHPIVDPQGLIISVLITIRNVTQLRKLTDEAARREQDIQLLTELVQADPKHLRLFWNEAQALLTTMQSDVGQRPAVQIARDMHSLKGLARSLGLRQLTGLIHDSESLLLGIPPSLESQHSILESITVLFSAYQDLFQQRLAGADTAKGGTLVDRESLLELEKCWLSRQGIDSAVKSLLCRFVFKSINELAHDLRDEGRRLAGQLKKDPFVLDAKGPAIFFRERTERNLRNALLHLLRNTLDHGFLKTSDRDHEARVELDWEWHDEKLLCTWRDNGQGLNLKALVHRAFGAGRTIPSDRSEREALAESIFHDGVSTAETISEVSGRGIGMSAARAMLESLGGTLDIELLEPFDQERQTFQFRLSLPRQHIIEV